MSSAGAAPHAAVPAPSAQTRAAAARSNARAEASRRNGAKSRGPKTAEGKARSARNALKHGLRAQKYVVLPEEDAAEFAELRAALIEELAPVGALQTLLARRVAVAAWRVARADRIELELFEERGYGNASPGLALIRDGNGTRSFETLQRYRGAAIAEFMRSLRTLKALQAESRRNEAKLATLPPPPPKPNEPDKARKNTTLASGPASAAALRPASGDGAHAWPEPCAPSGRMFGPPSNSRTPALPSNAGRTQEMAPEQ